VEVVHEWQASTIAFRPGRDQVLPSEEDKDASAAAPFWKRRRDGRPATETITTPRRCQRERRERLAWLAWLLQSTRNANI
jgi:hypothetical protein